MTKEPSQESKKLTSQILLWAYIVLTSLCCFKTSVQAFDRSLGDRNLGGGVKQDPRTVFVQLFEWPWLEVAKECEVYLGPKGFAAVQVSPPQEHADLLESFWWSRYQVISYKILSRGGTESEFKEMVDRCHAAGVSVYVDVVLNHMTGFESGTGFAGSTFKHYEYPGIYDYNDFHHCGTFPGQIYKQDDIPPGATDPWLIQNCELVNLADLKTETPKVQKTLADYLNHLVDLGIDGFRVDASKHIPVNDLKNIFKQVKSNKYIYQELIQSPGENINWGEYVSFSDVNVFGFSYVVGRAFKDRNIVSVFDMNGWLPASDRAIVFLENHDLQRNDKDANTLISYRRDPQIYKVANAFVLTWPYGFPQVFSGYNYKNTDDGPPVDSNKKSLPILDENLNCKAPWICEHRIPGMAALVQFRNFTTNAFYTSQLWSNGRDQMAYSRGSLGFVALNMSQNSMNTSLMTDMADGVYCNILDPSYNVDKKTCAKGFVKVTNKKISFSLDPTSALVVQAGTSVETFGK